MAEVVAELDEFGHHALPDERFDALAQGDGDAATVRALWTSERSRRLILLRAVLERAGADPGLVGPLATADYVWDVLLRAQRASPESFDSALLHPQWGSWVTYSLRRERGGADSGAPLWVDFGCVHALALAAAASCRVDCQIGVPLRSGRLMIPRFGSAQFAGAPPWDVAQARTDSSGAIHLRYGADEILVSSDDSSTVEGWSPLRRLDVGTSPALSVWIDDLDPFRDLADPIAPARLDNATVESWRAMLAEAWDILCHDHRPTAEALASCLVSLVPLPVGAGWGTRSASTGDAFGSVMVSPPSDAVTFAVALVHEFMHIKLGGVMHLAQLTHDDPRARLYAPWRDDPRPLGGLLQGVYAFLGIAAFWREHRLRAAGDERTLAHFEYAYARQQTAEGLAAVVGSGSLTSAGRRFTEGIAQRLASWADDGVPDDAASLAAAVGDSHRAGWRLRHVRPDPTDVRRLTDAWIAGQSAPATSDDSTVEAGVDVRWSQPRLGLARRRILVPEQYRDVDDQISWATGLKEPDFALMAGDAPSARDGFEALVAERGDDVEAWSGLGVAVSEVGPPEAAAVLSRRPELVFAVYQQIATRRAAASPVALATWIGAGKAL